MKKITGWPFNCMENIKFTLFGDKASWVQNLQHVGMGEMKQITYGPSTAAQASAYDPPSIFFYFVFEAQIHNYYVSNKIKIHTSYS